MCCLLLYILSVQLRDALDASGSLVCLCRGSERSCGRADDLTRDPVQVRNRCGAARLWRESGSLMQVRHSSRCLSVLRSNAGRHLSNVSASHLAADLCHTVAVKSAYVHAASGN